MRFYLNMIFGCRSCGRRGWHSTRCTKRIEMPKWYFNRIKNKYGCQYCNIRPKMTAAQFDDHQNTVHPFRRHPVTW